MLAEMTPQQLAEWRAARYVVPLDDGWRIGGTIAASAHNTFERYLATKSGRRVIDASRLRTPDDYIPKIRSTPAASIVANVASIDAHQAAMESRYLK